MLKRILDSEKITINQLVAGYKHYYKNEVANKEHVLKSLEDGLLKENIS